MLVCFQVYSTEINILFTANINGNLENCNCGANSSGGIGRIKTFFSEFRNQYPHTFIVDGGDYFNSYPFEKLNTAMLRALSFLDYDIMVPGDQEFIEGMGFFNNYKNQYKPKLLISNIHLDTNINLKFYVKDINIFFYAYLSNHAFDFIDKPGEINCFPFSDIRVRGGFGASGHSGGRSRACRY